MIPKGALDLGRGGRKSRMRYFGIKEKNVLSFHF